MKQVENEFAGIIGLSEADAMASLKKMGIVRIRVMEKNGERFMGTTDHRLDRVNLRINEDKVFSASRG